MAAGQHGRCGFPGGTGTGSRHQDRAALRSEVRRRAGLQPCSGSATALRATAPHHHRLVNAIAVARAQPPDAPFLTGQSPPAIPAAARAPRPAWAGGRRPSSAGLAVGHCTVPAAVPPWRRAPARCGFCICAPGPARSARSAAPGSQIRAPSGNWRSSQRPRGPPASHPGSSAAVKIAAALGSPSGQSSASA
jgi:hypothetical protein